MALTMRRNRGRNLWVLSFFLLGTIVPLALTTYSWLARPPASESAIENAFLDWIWVIWPTWIFMLGTENTAVTIVMLLSAALLNGLWYAVVATIVWYTAALLKRLVRFGLGRKT